MPEREITFITPVVAKGPMCSIEVIPPLTPEELNVLRESSWVKDTNTVRQEQGHTSVDYGAIGGRYLTDLCRTYRDTLITNRDRAGVKIQPTEFR